MRVAPGRNRSVHVATPSPETDSAPPSPSTTTSTAPRTATRTPPASATASANGGIALSDVPNAPVRASITAPMPPPPTLRHTAVAVPADTAGASTATAPFSAATHHPVAAGR